MGIVVDTDFGIPRNLAEFDAEWLTQALAAAAPGVRVTHVSVEDCNFGTSTRMRLKVDYNNAGCAAGLPRRLFVKSAIDNPNRDYFTAVGMYAQEVHFFKELRPQFAISTPRCFYAAEDPASGDFVLLEEDLGERNARWGRATQPLTRKEAEAVLLQIADFHGHFWGASVLYARPWLNVMADSPQATTCSAYAARAAEELVAGRFGTPPASLRDVRAIERAYHDLMGHDRAATCTLLHGDAHPGNVAFVDGEPVFSDWQVTRRGLFAHDVSYFMAMALTVEDRRRYQEDLLRSYLRRLEHACAAPSFDEAFLAFRATLLYGLLMWAATPTTMQPEDILNACVTRLVAAADDLDTMAAIATLVRE